MPDPDDRPDAAAARVAAWPLRTMQRHGPTPRSARARR
jgi:hypothetical protein